MTNSPTTAKFSKTGNFIGIGFTEKDVIVLEGVGYTISNTFTNPLNEPIVEIDFSWNGNFIGMCGATQYKFRSFTNAGAWSITGFKNVVSCKLNKDDGLGVAMNVGLKNKR